MRRNIFDILEEEMNLEYEIETIVNLFNEARIYGFNINYSIEDYFDQECIHLWKNRKYVTSSKQMRERLGCSAEGSDCGGNSMVRAFSIAFKHSCGFMLSTYRKLFAKQNKN